MKAIVKIIIVGILLGPGLVQANEDFNLKIKVTKAKAKKAYLAYYNAQDEMKIDSATIKNGVFRFSGKTDGPLAVHVFLDYDNVGFNNLFSRDINFKKVYIEKGHNFITAADFTRDSKISGSKIHDEFEHYLTYTEEEARELTMAIDSELASAALVQKKDPFFMDKIEEMYNQVWEGKFLRLEQYIKENPDSHFSLLALKELAGNKDLVMIRSIFARLSARLINSAAGREFAELLAASNKHWCDRLGSVYSKN